MKRSFIYHSAPALATFTAVITNALKRVVGSLDFMGIFFRSAMDVDFAVEKAAVMGSDLTIIV